MNQTLRSISHSHELQTEEVIETGDTDEAKKRQNNFFGIKVVVKRNE